MPPVSRADPLDVVEQKVARGERLSAADGLALFESPDLLRVGRLADQVRRRKVGDDVYFVVNRHINYTNICRNRCRFCAFSRDRGRAGRLLADGGRGARQGAGEHRAGGHRDPHRGRGASRSALRRCARDDLRDPGAVARPCTSRPSPPPRSSTSPRAEGLPVEQILRDLQAAGLDSLPGGGAEIFAERGADRGLPGQDIGRALAGGPRAGAPAGPEDQRHHALRPRGDATRTGWTTSSGCGPAQDETGGFQAFIALAFQPAANTPLSHLPGHHRRGRPQDHGGRPSAAGQLRPHQDLLGHDRAEAGPDRAVLRRQRHGRHGGGGGHLADVGGRARAGAVQGRAGAGHPRRRPGAGGARRALSGGAALRRTRRPRTRRPRRPRRRRRRRRRQEAAR